MQCCIFGCMESGALSCGTWAAGELVAARQRLDAARAEVRELEEMCGISHISSETTAEAVAEAVAAERAAVVAYLLKVALADGDWGIYNISGAVEKGRHRE
jgi:hypothetical protein